MVASWASSVLAYGSYLTYKYLYDGFFLFRNKKKYNTFWTTPLPTKKARGYEWSRYGYTHMCLLIPAACDLDFH